MQFKQVKVSIAQGYRLAHNIKNLNGILKKGSLLNKKSIEFLIKSKIKYIYIYIKEKNDVDENKAAKLVASFICEKNLFIDKPNNGRADIYSKKNGMLIINKNKLIKLNKTFKDLAVCSLRSHTIIQAGQLVGNIKVLPYAINKKIIDKLVSNIKFKSIFMFKVSQVKKVGLIISQENNKKKKLKVHDALLHRLKSLVLKINLVKDTTHTIEGLSAVMYDLLKKDFFDLLLIYGSTSIVDKNDIIPYAIKLLKGKIITFGLPADPGNLSLVAKINKTKVIGVPGCASSPKRNGFDIILERLCFGEDVNINTIAEISEGGLFKTQIKKEFL